MLVGYARVSTLEQTLDLQRDALAAAGCREVFTDIVSGSVVERLGLRDALHYLRAGDTLVVWCLDRLGRSLKHLIETVTQLHEREIGFRSLTENIDTTTSTGKLIFHVFGALAEFERDLIRERTTAGLAAARARGRRGGRPIASPPIRLQWPRASTPITSTAWLRSVRRSTSLGQRCIATLNTGDANGPVEASSAVLITRNV